MSLFSRAIDRSGKSFFVTPFIFINTHNQSCSLNIKLLRPITDWLAYSMQRKEMRSACILHLFRRCNPSTVSRFIVSIIVNSINLMNQGRRNSYVPEERFKRYLPFLAYRNSSPSISIESFCRRIRTATIHIDPCLPFFRLFPASCLSMNEVHMPIIAREI